MRERFLYIATFFTFIGYSAYLLLVFNFGLSNQSTVFSFGLRMLIVFSLLVFYIKSEKLKPDITMYLFLIFSFFYLARILIDELKDLKYYVETYTLIIYYITFCLFPFMLLVNTKMNFDDFNIIRRSVLFSGFIFSALALNFFSKYIGTVSRLTSGTAENDVMSPLALSYCSILIIGVAVAYWMENSVSFKEKIFLLVLIGLSVVPFLLGASRGSLIALLIPFLIMLIAKPGIKKKISTIFFIVLFIAGTITLSEASGSGLVDRFTSTTSDMEEGNESAIRTVMWHTALEQFMNHPIMGDRLGVANFSTHPHNILVEALQTTGLLGFVPLLFFLLLIFKKIVTIFRRLPKYSWVGVIFIQSLMQYLFSGSIYGAAWVFTSAAIVVALCRLAVPASTQPPISLLSNSVS